jgi:hypothetical protein
VDGPWPRVELIVIDELGYVPRRGRRRIAVPGHRRESREGRDDVTTNRPSPKGPRSSLGTTRYEVAFTWNDGYRRHFLVVAHA